MIGVYVSSRNKCGTCLIEAIYLRLSLNYPQFDSFQTINFYTPNSTYYSNLLSNNKLQDFRPNIFEAEKGSCIVGDFCVACIRDFTTDIFEIDSSQYELRYVFQIRNPLDILVSEY